MLFGSIGSLVIVVLLLPCFYPPTERHEFSFSFLFITHNQIPANQGTVLKFIDGTKSFLSFVF